MRDSFCVEKNDTVRFPFHPSFHGRPAHSPLYRRRLREKESNKANELLERLAIENAKLFEFEKILEEK
jgi:hypothetical protein